MLELQQKKLRSKISRLIMTIIDSLILGVIEGFTEFLPISSTGHLIVVSEFLGLEQSAINKAYEVIIQLSAILAVIFNCNVFT